MAAPINHAKCSSVVKTAISDAEERRGAQEETFKTAMLSSIVRGHTRHNQSQSNNQLIFHPHSVYLMGPQIVNTLTSGVVPGSLATLPSVWYNRLICPEGSQPI